jgi:hypothetical protein
MERGHPCAHLYCVSVSEVIMTDRQKSDELTERQDDATDKRTLDEIEEEENVSTEGSDSPSPSPDEGSGRATGDDAGDPM